MLALALALTAPCVFGQLHAGYQVSVRGETRVRPTFAQPGQVPLGADLELAPSAALDVTSGLWRFFAEYSPNLSLPEPYAGGDPALRHSASLAAELRPNHVDRLLATARASYGRSDFLEPVELSTSGPQPLQPGTMPIEATPRLLSTRTLDAAALLGADVLASRRLRLGLSAGYLVGGALDEEGLKVLPFRRGPELRAHLGYELTAIDQLHTALWATHADFSNGSKVSVLELTEQWRRRLNPRTEGTLTLGGAGLRTQPLGQAAGLAAVPVGAAGLTHRVAGHENQVEATLSAGVVPFVDRFAGTGYLRIESLGGVNVIHDQQLRLGVRGGAAYNVSGGPVAGDRSAVVDLLASYDFDRKPVPSWRVGAFLHGILAQSAHPPGPIGFQWSVGVAATFREVGSF